MSALRTDRPKNGGDNKVRDRIAYASKREKELLAAGVEFAEAWDIIRAECRAGAPERKVQITDAGRAALSEVTP